MKKINRFIVKLGLMLLVILLVLIATFFLIQKGVKELDERRVALIDKIGNNYVFRGNNPFVIKNGKTVFAYDEITSSFNDILQKEGHKTLGNYYLIDVSLLDLDQYQLIEKEEEFFAKHSEYGEVINFSTLSPSLLFGAFSNFSIVNNSVNNYDLWITDTLKKIHDLASKQVDRQVVVYIHCDSGRDRTGLMITGYRLLFRNVPLKKIRMMDLKEVSRSSVASYDGAIRSYCAYVKKTYNKPDDYCEAL
jgi:hypothetical protein